MLEQKMFRYIFFMTEITWKHLYKMMALDFPKKSKATMGMQNINQDLQICKREQGLLMETVT